MTKGFTLIELLVVIAIIGILSSVVLASLGTARQKARDATRISDMKNIQLALELYFDSAQAYPPNTAGTANNHHISGATFNTALVGPALYIPVMPNDPQAASRTNAEEYAYDGMTAADADCSAAALCPRFFLGAWLERADNLVLDGDTGDSVDNGAVTGLGIGSCDTGATNGANGTTEQCYSLVP